MGVWLRNCAVIDGGVPPKQEMAIRVVGDKIARLVPDREADIGPSDEA